jgi:hypothetical protein
LLRRCSRAHGAVAITASETLDVGIDLGSTVSLHHLDLPMSNLVRDLLVARRTVGDSVFVSSSLEGRAHCRTAISA